MSQEIVVAEQVLFPEDARKVVFAREFLKTNNVREAYKTATGDSNPAVASRWLTQLEENGFMDVLRREMLKDTTLTLSTHLQKLAELRDAAAGEGKYGPAIAAEIARGKAAGLYEEKDKNKDITDLSNLTLKEIEDKLSQLEGMQKKASDGLKLVNP